jgi:membrane protease YdiL (CAAX protease family)
LTEPPDPVHPVEPDAEPPAPVAAPEPGAPELTPEPSRPGLRTFSLEGRRAPGLYLAGWLATVLGGPLFVAAFLSGVVDVGRVALLIVGSALLGTGLIAVSGAQAIERRDRTDLPYRGPSPFLVFAASVPVTILVTLPIVLTGLEVSSPTATLLSVIATGGIWLGLVGLTVVGTGALGWREIAVGLADAPPARLLGDVLVGAAAALPVILATSIVAAILIGLVGAAPEGPIAIPSDPLGLVVSLLAAAVVAPIGEEVFYRGFATTAWARSMGPTAAIVRGGLFFAFVHVLTLSGSDFGDAARVALVAFLARLPVAFALGWIFVRRGSLAASIGLHATFNAALILLAALAGSAAR